MSNTTLTAIDGLLAGHATDDRNHTGCTAILCPQGFTPGIAVPGFAPGCRETELMRPESQVDTVHGLLLAGGSAFGQRCRRGRPGRGIAHVRIGQHAGPGIHVQIVDDGPRDDGDDTVRHGESVSLFA